MAEQNYMQQLNKLEATLDEYFGNKAPSLSPQVKEIIVKVAPYVAILSILITVPSLLILFGLGSLATVLAPFGGVETMRTMPLWWVSVILLIPVAILNAMAIPALFARSATGWKYMFWAELISVVSNLITFNILGALIGGAIGFYLLFQVKSYYH